MLQTVDPPFHNVSGMARSYLQFALCKSPTVSTPEETTSTYQNYRTNPAANKLFEINNRFVRAALRLRVSQEVNLPFESEMLLKIIDTSSQVQPPALPTDPPGPTVAKPLLPFRATRLANPALFSIFNSPWSH